MIEQAFMKVFEEAMKTATYKGYDEAILLSSGGVSLGQLAAEDHPYARRHGMPLRDPTIINAQTGAFRNDWKNPPPTVMGDTIEGYIENHNPVADYLTQPDGAPNSKMFQRPIDKEVEAFTETELENQILKGLAAFSKTDIYV